VKRKIYIGTSGFIYTSWVGRFYPENLKENKLIYYSQFFDTVEINSTFYRLPDKKTFESWYKQTPKNFKFAIKLSRYITHTKKLKVDDIGKKAIKNFIKNSLYLKNKLKIVLVQLPKNFNCNLERLDSFLKFISKTTKNKNIKFALEFRNENWFNQECYEILKKYKAALVVNDSPYFPKVIEFTTSFTYIRMHGPSWLYASKYSENQLQTLKKEINRFPKSIKQVYIYFNNDYKAFATEDALYLKEIM